MAKNKPINQSDFTKSMSNVIKNIETDMSHLYRATYFSSNSNQKDLNKLHSDLEDQIDSIVTKNTSNGELSGLSKLMLKDKIANVSNNKNIVENINDMLSNESALSNLNALMSRKAIKEYDRQIDMICTYMTKLEEALALKKDNVLSADCFSKDFINISDNVPSNKSTIYNSRISEMKKKYDLNRFYDDLYDKAAKYGDQFVYVVPYKIALKRLIDRKSATTTANGMVVQQRTFFKEGVLIVEGGNPIDFEGAVELFKEDNFDIKVVLDRSGILESVINPAAMAEKMILESSVPQSLSESFISEVNEAMTEAVDKSIKMDKTIRDDLEMPMDASASDGFIGATGNKSSGDIKVPGALVEVLKRENVVPYYIGNTCMGYFYLEFDFDPDILESDSISMNSSVVSRKGQQSLTNNLTRQNDFLKRYTDNICGFIDSNFVNTNQDLKKEIYDILKANDIASSNMRGGIKISYLPANDVEHVYFELDKKTHRGISDLNKSMVPATMFSALYVSNTIGVMTRGYDKRVYYVKQNIETNVAKTMLNVLNQIKKGNMGAREFEGGLYRIMNVIGRYNDHIIPLSQGGDSPVQTEIMQGQNIDIKTDLLNMLEEMAVNLTGITIDMLQTRQSVDYAAQVSMTNSKVLRDVYKRQSLFEPIMSRIASKIYNYEYDENEVLDVRLPSPAFLLLQNTNQLMDNANQYAQNIVDTEMVGDQYTDEHRAKYKNKILRSLIPAYMNINMIESAKHQTMIEVDSKKVKTEEE